MPNAKRPENAPPDAAEVYSIAMRVCISFGKYHFEMINTAPGRNPALEYNLGQLGFSRNNAKTLTQKDLGEIE